MEEAHETQPGVTECSPGVSADEEVGAAADQDGGDQREQGVIDLLPRVLLSNRGVGLCKTCEVGRDETQIADVLRIEPHRSPVPLPGSHDDMQGQSEDEEDREYFVDDEPRCAAQRAGCIEAEAAQDQPEHEERVAPVIQPCAELISHYTGVWRQRGCRSVGDRMARGSPYQV